MPHIRFEKNELLVLPQKSTDGVLLKFCTKLKRLNSHNIEYKIGVECEKKIFLLSLKEKNGYYLLKADKVTRIAPVSLIQKAIRAYATLSHAHVLFSNVESFKQKIEPQREYLKTIDYFIDQFPLIDSPIQLEIGFGSGRHILHQALNNPDKLFIGLEIHYPSIEQLLKQIKFQSIQNILVAQYDARLFMECLPSNRIEKIFVHFPVPWDKKPHRRVFSESFIQESRRVLCVKGTLELRTDSKNYFNYSLSLLTSLDKARIGIDINQDLEISSKYEDRWKRKGKTIYDVTLTNTLLDKQLEFHYDFIFNSTLSIHDLEKEFQPVHIIKKDHFVHVEELFLNDDVALIKLTMGHFNQPISKYLILHNDTIQYYQGLPLPTTTNIKAHHTLNRFLNNLIRKAS